MNNGEVLISGSHDGTVKLWKAKQGRCVYTMSHAHTDWITCSSAASNTAVKFATGSNDNIVVLWKLDGSRIFPIRKFRNPKAPNMMNCTEIFML